jgi:hypothetical protein
MVIMDKVLQNLCLIQMIWRRRRRNPSMLKKTPMVAILKLSHPLTSWAEIMVMLHVALYPTRGTVMDVGKADPTTRTGNQAVPGMICTAEVYGRHHSQTEVNAITGMNWILVVMTDSTRTIADKYYTRKVTAGVLEIVSITGVQGMVK